jgi:hypothetical protein
VDLLLGGGVGDEEKFVAGPQPHPGRGNRGPSLPDDGRDDRALGEGDLGECAARGTGLRGDGGFDDVDARLAQPQQRDGVGGTGRLLDEGDQGPVAGTATSTPQR